ncbi:hypothetical protein FUAX_44190 (plasmid) [Fulvitalea axinellae]|uniref:RagB/SusD family nutrient uptake outer membrane protein n=1 Tax=Fulvitalea axinellae TaxID=1182444 RepID=A0AAU9CYE9_9BACT|nr:hypothetical protein FUAX_44190 [Fulvitalea axinellae]
MKRTLYILSLSLLTGLMSCNDLEEAPFSQISQDGYSYSNPRQAMGIAYANMRYLMGIQEYYMSQELCTDEIVAPANASGWDDGGIFKKMHFHSWDSESPQSRHLWSKPYTGIIHCNRVIEQLESGLIPATDEIKTEYMAEMRAVRAFYYWQLMDNFGDVPLVTSSSQELPELSTRKELYDFIVAELTAIDKDLNEAVDSKSYGTFHRWAGKALLANVYLNAEVYTGEAKWDACLKVCQEIIDSGKYMMDADYRTPFSTNNHADSKEIIFPIVFDNINAKGNNFTHLFSWGAGMKDKLLLNSTPWGAGTAMGITQHIDTYDEKDGRLADNWLIGTQYKHNSTEPCLGNYDKLGKPLTYTKDIPNASYTSETEGYRMNKFEVKVGAEFQLDNDFPFFRYTQVMMMKAECLLRQGKADEAATLVTQVRKRNFENESDATLTGADLNADTKYQYGFYKTDYGTEIEAGDQSAVAYGGLYDELGYEFAWEAHRRRDMIRFGTFTTKSWLSHKPNGDHRKVFPIPQQAINANPKLEQRYY